MFIGTGAVLTVDQARRAQETGEAGRMGSGKQLANFPGAVTPVEITTGNNLRMNKSISFHQSHTRTFSPDEVDTNQMC
jgi:hypothetical protein